MIYTDKNADELNDERLIYLIHNNKIKSAKLANKDDEYIKGNFYYSVIDKQIFKVSAIYPRLCGNAIIQITMENGSIVYKNNMIRVGNDYIVEI